MSALTARAAARPASPVTAAPKRAVGAKAWRGEAGAPATAPTPSPVARLASVATAAALAVLSVGVGPAAADLNRLEAAAGGGELTEKEERGW